jgi:hypothetical protein
MGGTEPRELLLGGAGCEGGSGADLGELRRAVSERDVPAAVEVDAVVEDLRVLSSTSVLGRCIWRSLRLGR